MTIVRILMLGDEGDPVSRVIHWAQIRNYADCSDRAPDEELDEGREYCDAEACLAEYACYRLVCGSSRGPLETLVEELTDAEAQDLIRQGWRWCKRRGCR